MIILKVFFVNFLKKKPSPISISNKIRTGLDFYVLNIFVCVDSFSVRRFFRVV